jgi:cytidylate kinase
MSNKVCIAIDGPAAAGKSTVAKHVADRLSYLYIDTGAMYRALTYVAIQQDADLQNGVFLSELLKGISIQLSSSTTDQHVYVNEKDVTAEIRSDDVTNHVSFVAKHREVRTEMVKRQQLLGKDGGVVMDGRDIGTHVLPNAQVKIFLSASVEERAKRRYSENIAAGYGSDLEQMIKDIALRDKRDSERETAPLTKAKDAVEIDTTGLTIGDVVHKILNIIAERT